LRAAFAREWAEMKKATRQVARGFQFSIFGNGVPGKPVFGLLGRNFGDMAIARHTYLVGVRAQAKVFAPADALEGCRPFGVLG
jgi:hypothetical protein